MSRLSPFSPSQTKAIWLQSGEKAACVSRPGKLVKGTMFKTANGYSLGGRKNIAQIASPIVNPSAGQIANQPQWPKRLARGFAGKGSLSYPVRGSAPFPIGARRGSELDSESSFSFSSWSIRGASAGGDHTCPPRSSQTSFTLATKR